MVRRIHDHYLGPGTGRIGPCDCPNPLAPSPSWPSRPPPTGYRDEAGTYHPGPGGAGYAEHVTRCAACLLYLSRAAQRGEAWARGMPGTPVPTLLPGPGEGPIEMPIPGPGMPREQQALVQLQPRHVGPGAVVVGALSYALVTVLPWWLAGPALVGLLMLLVVVGGRVELDRLPPARARELLPAQHRKAP